MQLRLNIWLNFFGIRGDLLALVSRFMTFSTISKVSFRAPNLFYLCFIFLLIVGLQETCSFAQKKVKNFYLAPNELHLEIIHFLFGESIYSYSDLWLRQFHFFFKTQISKYILHLCVLNMWALLQRKANYLALIINNFSSCD